MKVLTTLFLLFTLGESTSYIVNSSSNDQTDAKRGVDGSLLTCTQNILPYGHKPKWFSIKINDTVESVSLNGYFDHYDVNVSLIRNNVLMKCNFNQIRLTQDDYYVNNLISWYDYNCYKQYGDYILILDNRKYIGPLEICEVTINNNVSSLHCLKVLLTICLVLLTILLNLV